MTDKAIYGSLIDGIFGAGTTAFDTSGADTNNVIGAIANSGQFSQFQSCFTARLLRLQTAILANANLRQPILNAVNQIADNSNWDGAYAELCALDYFLADSATGATAIELDATVPATETLASDMGMQNANHDLRSPTLGVTMDTKLLSDKTADILAGIFKDALKAKGIKHLTIIPSYPLDRSFSVYQSNRKALLAELTTLIDVVNRPRKANSNVIPALSYQFAWEAGVFSSVNEYNPKEHAQNHHHLLFGHAKKFSRVEPTILVFVHFPWSGEPLWMEDSAKQFFKGLGVCFFDQYQGSTVEARTVYRQFKTSISLEQVTKHLSGIVFLQDRSILATSTSQVNAEASYLWNSHAALPLKGTPFEQYLQRRQALDLSTLT